MFSKCFWAEKPWGSLFLSPEWILAGAALLRWPPWNFLISGRLLGIRKFLLYGLRGSKGSTIAPHMIWQGDFWKFRCLTWFYLEPKKSYLPLSFGGYLCAGSWVLSQSLTLRQPKAPVRNLACCFDLSLSRIYFLFLNLLVLYRHCKWVFFSPWTSPGSWS